MLLVSGVVETNAGPMFRRSQARILAQTERRLEVSVPLKETRLLPSGEELLRPSLRLFTLEIPLYTDGPIEEQTALTSTKHMLRAGGIDLPVGIVNRRYAFIVPTEIVRTEGGRRAGGPAAGGTGGERAVGRGDHRPAGNRRNEGRLLCTDRGIYLH